MSVAPFIFFGVVLIGAIPLAATAGGGVAGGAFQITAEDRAHWAFQPLQRPEVPQSAGNPVDAFVTGELGGKGLAMNPSATSRELIRRAYFDLTGLPPTPEEVAAFEMDNNPESYSRLIDRLLAAPQYGERWGRHWLDVVRFAQSDGYERDAEKLLAWRYRDYVIKAFNDDKPYDRFVMEQIAGDELPDATAESVAATGFQRLGVFNDEPDDKRMAEFDALDDVLSTTGTVFLGLTIGCARCHDHKFDPIPQSDYYSMLAFFSGVRPYENARTSADPPAFVPLAPPGEGQRWLSERKTQLKALEAERTAAPDAKQKLRLDAEIKELSAHEPFEWALAVRERGPDPPETHLLLRGNASSEGAKMEPAFLSILNPGVPTLPIPAPGAPSSGRRLVLARWIASPENPLTARVVVNRVWQHHFGRGLVRTTTDFGRSRAPPTHPGLLDWLASEFINSGWSLKKLHTLIMRSETYRQSSRAANERALGIDPDNDLLWRQNLRRIEAEAVRDSFLCIAGTLNPKMGGRGFFPHLGGEVLAGQSRPGLDWEVSSEAEQSRRSVYAYVRRTMAIPLLENFDYNNTTSPLAERAVTTVAPQALMLLNDEFLHRQATAFAARLVRETGNDPAARIRRAYQLAVNRDPTPHESEIAAGFLRRQTASFSALPPRLIFQPDVANALSTDYFSKLEPHQFLTGPRRGWQYFRGFWAPAYEGIRVVDRERAPFAWWDGASFADGIIEARLRLATSCEFASLLFRATAEGDDARGYELVLDPRGQRVVLRCRNSEPVVLAEAPADICAGKSFAVRIDAAGPRFEVTLNADARPLLEVTHRTAIETSGHVGVRTWGGSVEVDDLAVTVRSGDAVRRLIVPSEAAEPQLRALESFCLVMFNLNEVVYVD